MTLVVATVMSALPSRPSAEVALAVMTGVVALSGWFAAWGAGLATAGMAWLMLNGFVVDQYGELHWHGSSDVVRLVALLGCGAAVAAVRAAQLRRRQRRKASSQLDLELRELTRAARRTWGGPNA